MKLNSNLNLKSLEAFTTIVETGSATEAARVLGLTQPGISRQLANLEEVVGFQLFYREKSRLLPTEEAHILYQEVTLFLNGANRLTELAHNLFFSNSGTLRIVAPSSFITGPLQDIIAKFIVNNPMVKFVLDTQSPASARELIARRSVDCGFVQLPEEHPGIKTEPLIESKAVCVLSKDHPLANLEKISIENLRGQNLIVLGKGRSSRERIDVEFRKLNARMKIILEAHTVAVACSFAKKDLGIALVNELLAQQYLNDDLVARPLLPTIKYSYGFATSEQGKMSRLTESFLKFCQSEFKTMGQVS